MQRLLTRVSLLQCKPWLKPTPRSSREPRSEAASALRPTLAPLPLRSRGNAAGSRPGAGVAQQQHRHCSVHTPGAPAQGPHYSDSHPSWASGGGVRSAILSAALSTGSLAGALAGVVTALREHALVEKMRWGMHPGPS